MVLQYYRKKRICQCESSIKIASRLLLLALIAIFFAASASFGMEKNEGRFFLSGDGEIHIINDKNGIEANISLLGADGSVSEEGLNAADRVFGYPALEEGGHIAPRLIFMLDYFSDLVAPGAVIHIQSGYRSPQYNDTLKKAGGNVARTSTHMDGMAADFSINGIDGKKLWEIIRRHNCCGVGHYGGRSIHLDSGKPRFWEASTSGVTTGQSDFNRRMYLSTEYDRYRQGEVLKLLLSSISNYGFGIEKAVFFVREQNGEKQAGEVSAEVNKEGSCILIKDRKAARSVSSFIPAGIEPGRYRVLMKFCERPFGVMPEKILSNEIEILPGK